MGLDVILEVELGETPEREFVKKEREKKTVLKNMKILLISICLSSVIKCRVDWISRKREKTVFCSDGKELTKKEAKFSIHHITTNTV